MKENSNLFSKENGPNPHDMHNDLNRVSYIYNDLNIYKYKILVYRDIKIYKIYTNNQTSCIIERSYNIICFQYDNFHIF